MAEKPEKKQIAIHIGFTTVVEARREPRNMAEALRLACQQVGQDASTASAVTWSAREVVD